MLESLKDRGLPQRDLIGQAEERGDQVERLSAERAVIPRRRAAAPADRGAGKGRQRQDLARGGADAEVEPEGRRVALTGYSRGLVTWLQRRVASFLRTEQPAYVGTFHNLGVEWGRSDRK